MKTKSILIALLVTVMSSALFANDREKLSDAKAIIRSSGKSSVYQLVYLSEVPGTVSVSILDAKGKTIMTDRVKNVEEGFMRPYNFSALAEGNYVIEVQDSKGKVKVPFIHKVNKAVQPMQLKVKALPTDKKYQLIMVGSQADVLQVNILDGDRTLVYTDYIDANNSFSKVYDLTKVKASNFTFEIRNSNEIITTQQF